MLDNLKGSIAPILLRRASGLLRSSRLPKHIKSFIWLVAQRYATFYSIESHCTIKNGMEMRVSSGPRVEQEIFLFGEWEPLLSRYLMEIEPNENIFLDVGANIGYFSLLASSTFGSVHAIEASPSTFRRLAENVEANRLLKVSAYQIAVGGYIGKVDFYKNTEQSGGSSVFQSENSIFETEASIAPLEEILKDIDWKLVRFVKIDVEGLEAPVLSSLFRLRDTLHRDVEILVEYDPARENTWPEIKAFIAVGFSAAIMQGPYDRVEYLDANRRTTLEPCTDRPLVFCDLLLRRTSFAPNV